MLSTLSNRRLPRHVDPLKFAHQGIEIDANLAVAEFDRLQDLLVSHIGNASVKLAFNPDYQYKGQLTGSIVADLSLICQRCLAPFSLPIECQFKLMMVATEQQAESLPDGWEPLPVNDEQIDLYKLIEDELLLALPIVPYHQQRCITADSLSCGEYGDDSQMQIDKHCSQAELANPFEVLKDFEVTRGH